MVNLLIIDTRPKSEVIDIVAGALQSNGIPSNLVTYTSYNQEAIQLLMETNPPDFILLHEPTPVGEFVNLIKQSGLASKTIVTWGKKPESEIKKYREEFAKAGVPPEQITGSGSIDLLINLAKGLNKGGKHL